MILDLYKLLAFQERFVEETSMELLNEWLLPIILFWPAVAALLVLVSKNERTIKVGSVVARDVYKRQTPG